MTSFSGILPYLKVYTSQSIHTWIFCFLPSFTHHAKNEGRKQDLGYRIKLCKSCGGVEITGGGSLCAGGRGCHPHPIATLGDERAIAHHHQVTKSKIMMFITHKRRSPRAHAQTHTHPPRIPDAHTHARTSALPVHRRSSQPGLCLRREGLGGCVRHRLRHVARPAGTGRHATGRERLPPQHAARTHKHHHQRVRARGAQKNQIPQKTAFSLGVTVAGLSDEATTALSHEVTDASPEGVGVMWPGSG